MQSDAFNEQLRKHAARFIIQPDDSSFERVMKKRSNKRKKRAVILLAVASVVMTSVAVWAWQGLLQNESGNKASYNMESGTRAAVPEKVLSDDSRKERRESRAANGEAETIELAKQGRPDTKTTNMSAVILAEAGSKSAGRMISNNPKMAPEAGGTITKEGRPHSTPIVETGSTVAHAEAAGKAQRVEGTTVIKTAPVDAMQADTVTEMKETPSQILAAAAPAPPLPASAVSNTRKWNIAFLVTPQLLGSAYSANSDANLAWFKDYYDNKVENDKARFCYNAGIKVERSLSKNFGVSAGVLFSSVRFAEVKVSRELVHDSTKSLAASPNPVYTEKFDRNRLDISFNSVEFPVAVTFSMLFKKIEIQASTGISYAYLVSTRSLVFDQDDTLNIAETNDASSNRLQRHHLMLLAGVTAGYRVLPRCQLYAGPVFRYGLTSLYNEAYIIRQTPRFLGLEAGVKFSF